MSTTTSQCFAPEAGSVPAEPPQPYSFNLGDQASASMDAAEQGNGRCMRGRQPIAWPTAGRCRVPVCMPQGHGYIDTIKTRNTGAYLPHSG